MHTFWFASWAFDHFIAYAWKFKTLIFADLIGPEKAGLLCELLDEIGRKDLTAIVKEYMNKLDCK